MRSIGWAAALVAGGLVAIAPATGLGWAGHLGCGVDGAACGLFAPPCGFSPSGGPTCCEGVSCCALRAWEGYGAQGACGRCAEAPPLPATAGGDTLSHAPSRLFEVFQWTQIGDEPLSPGPLEAIAPVPTKTGRSATTSPSR